VRVRPLIRPEDLRSALDAAKLVHSRSEDLTKLAWGASEAAWRVVAWQRSPKTGDIRGVAKDIGRVGDAAIKLRRLSMRKLQPVGATSADRRAALARDLAFSQDPVHVGLLDAMQSETTRDAALELANRILVLDTWIAECASTQEAVGSGAEANEKSRKGLDERIVARDLGLELMHCYAELTGREIGVSRKSAGEDTGRLGGPLVRFLGAMFKSMRKRLAEFEDIAPLANSKIWHPSNEAFALWVRRFHRKSPRTRKNVR
jgi:hypothetical protein